jgi:hypothetical protein
LKSLSNFTVLQDNRLLKRWWDRDEKKIYSQRKRLPRTATPLAREIQKHFLSGTVPAVKFLRESGTAGSILEGLEILRYARGEATKNTGYRSLIGY